MRPRRRERPEADLYEAIVKLLRLHGVHVTRLAQSRASRQSEGVPDLWVMWRGTEYQKPCGFWIEVKGPKGRLSRAQCDWHTFALHAGVNVVVWRSLEDALGWLLHAGLRRHGLDTPAAAARREGEG